MMKAVSADLCSPRGSGQRKARVATAIEFTSGASSSTNRICRRREEEKQPGRGWQPQFSCLPPPIFCQRGDSHWFTVVPDKSRGCFDDKSKRRSGGGWLHVPLSSISRLAGAHKPRCFFVLPSERRLIGAQTNRSRNPAKICAFGPKGAEARRTKELKHAAASPDVFATVRSAVGEIDICGLRGAFSSLS